jgi:THO complex subunit 4
MSYPIESPLRFSCIGKQELFTTTVGPLRDVTLHFDAKGISKGVASVQFSRKGDGNKAYQQYNNRLIDGS